ncbi:UbiA prenyltransferase family protein [Dokdonella sp. MW10]|uniref:UbiA prenyltransferase family protein n=1 Tax=Dokdonella sp. MW10 TaxID=2992926 RepID=UPI003F7F4C2A
MGRARALVELSRPAQWIKNGFVLLPLFFGHELLDPHALSRTLVAALAFCLASSAVYALNDVLDAARDRHHPVKSRRPVARGAIDRGSALAFSASLAVLSLAVATAVAPMLAGVVAAYLLVQLAYSGGLKRVAWVDVAIIAAGFALRIVAGGVAAQVPLTVWILVMATLLALMLGLGKRHGDLVNVGGHQAHAASGYDVRGIERALAGLGGAVIAAYVLYTLSSDVIARHAHNPLVYSTPWVALGVLRYLRLVYRDAAGADPSRLALRDPWLLFAVTGWLATLVVILYA